MVIVTYHADRGLVDRMTPLLSQVAAIVVVDNGSTDHELAPVEAPVGDRVTELIQNGTNLGVAVALTTGIQWVARHGYPWALTARSGHNAWTRGRLGGNSCVRCAAFSATGSDQRRMGAGSSVPDPRGSVVCTINSGALHSVAAWRRLDGFRENFFIDYVDTEFSLRARAGGYGVLGYGVRPSSARSVTPPATGPPFGPSRSRTTTGCVATTSPVTASTSGAATGDPSRDISRRTSRWR